MKNKELLFIFILGFFSLSFADETLTITTYYPSPYGVYNELTTTSNAYLATTGGRVGIGTTSPGANLEVWGSSPTLKITQNAGVAGSALLMLTQAGGGGNTAGIGLRGRTNYIYNEAMDAYKIVFGPDLVFANAKMVVDINTGKVGIGTTSPGWGLQVHSATNHQYVVVSTGTASRDTGIQFQDSSGVVWYPRHGSDGKFHITYYNPSPLVNTPYLSIDRTGNVGIGATTPSERLDVGGGNVKMGYEQISGADSDTCNNCWRYVTATCSSGKYVIGGGCGSSAGGAVVYSKPGDNSSWSCYVNIGSTSGHANAYAICANIR